MARCGCTSGCNCSVIAGTGTTVTGVGTAANPYVINATGGQTSVLDTPTVDMTLTGTGAAGDPYVISSAVKISATAGNVLTAQADGLAVTCEDIQDCVGAGFAQGLQYDDAGNAFTARIDPAAGNTITQSPAGLFSSGGTPLTVADTNSVNLTLTPGNLLTADVIRDPAADNILTIGPAGVLVSCEAVQDCIGQAVAAGTGLVYNDVANSLSTTAAALVVADTPCIDLAGDGTLATPLTATPIISPVVGNNITCTAQGLFVPTGAATITTADTPCIAVDGDGSAGLPVTATPILQPGATNLLQCTPTGMAVLCEDVQDCVGNAFTQGLFYDDAANLYRARIDPVAGNQITQSAAGLLVPATVATVTTGPCGVSGTGTPADPIVAKVGTWPYPCDVTTFGGVVACDAAGVLRGEPPNATDCDQLNINTTVPATAIPAAPVNISSETLNYTNPSTCKPAVVIIEAEADVDFNVAVGSIVSMYQAGDEMFQIENTGSSVMSAIHTQTTKVACFALAPGASGSFTQNIEVDESVGGGSTYTRVQSIIRAFIFAI